MIVLLIKTLILTKSFSSYFSLSCCMVVVMNSGWQLMVFSRALAAAFLTVFSGWMTSSIRGKHRSSYGSSSCSFSLKLRSTKKELMVIHVHVWIMVQSNHYMQRTYISAICLIFSSSSKLTTQTLCAICSPRSRSSSMFGRTSAWRRSAWNIQIVQSP